MSLIPVDASIPFLFHLFSISVYGGTFVVNIDRTRGFRPEPSVQHIHSFERIRLPLPPLPPQPRIPPPQIWRTEVPRPVVERQNNFFRDNFQFDSRAFEGRFNLGRLIQKLEYVNEYQIIRIVIVYLINVLQNVYYIRFSHGFNIIILSFWLFRLLLNYSEF